MNFGLSTVVKGVNVHNVMSVCMCVCVYVYLCMNI